MGIVVCPQPILVPAALYAIMGICAMKRLLSGNEAIALGAWEAGVRYASAYPGTPSTEILENLAQYQGVRAEWSANEKVALDAAIGASLAGVRALAAMKHVGVNVAADSLFSASYTGVVGGLVLVSADDPGCWSSQNEQDNRQYARFAKIPCLEPSDSQEARDFVGLALDISEQFDTPVMLRTTTRISHSKSPVEVGVPTRRSDDKTPQFVRDVARFTLIPAHARLRHPVVEERMKRLAEYAETSSLNRIELGDRSLGIISASVAYQYAREVFAGASFLKLGMSYPLPARKIRDFAAHVERLVVVEELDPFFEEQIKAMGLAVSGKEYFPISGELSLDLVRAGALKLGVGDYGRRDAPSRPRIEPTSLPPRPPAMCPGCSHRGVMYALQKLKLNVLGDIGCYALGILPPFAAMHTCTCMGSSIGQAQGLGGVGVHKPFVAVIGDSTFFHSGLSPLASMVYNRTPGTVLILDNRTTGMTGQQGNPASGSQLQGEGRRVDIAQVVRGLGVEHLWQVDAYNVKEIEAAVRQALSVRDAPSVVLVSGACVFLPSAPRKPAVTVDAGVCNGCSLCFRVGCPAILEGELDVRTKKPKAVIDRILCVGCDICLQVCPRHAILRVGPDDAAEGAPA